MSAGHCARGSARVESSGLTSPLFAAALVFVVFLIHGLDRGGFPTRALLGAHWAAGLVVAVPTLAVAGFLSIPLIVLVIWTAATGIWLMRHVPSEAI